jgi:hypothetical protein
VGEGGKNVLIFFSTISQNRDQRPTKKDSKLIFAEIAKIMLEHIFRALQHRFEILSENKKFNFCQKIPPIHPRYVKENRF